jgi:hypothetical protein
MNKARTLMPTSEPTGRDAFYLLFRAALRWGRRRGLRLISTEARV